MEKDQRNAVMNSWREAHPNVEDASRPAGVILKRVLEAREARVSVAEHYESEGPQTTIVRVWQFDFG